MSETLTSTDAPADQPELNADEQESLAIAEANEGEQQQLLAGKFDSPQSLEQAYLELQKKLGESREEEPEADEPDEEPEEEEEQEEATEGQLTEDQAQQLYTMVGGEKAYQSMLEWASQTLSKEEIEMYDSVMGDGNANSIYFAVQALANKYTEAVGSEGQLLTGRGAAESNAVSVSYTHLTLPTILLV